MKLQYKFLTEFGQPWMTCQSPGTSALHALSSKHSNKGLPQPKLMVQNPFASSRLFLPMSRAAEELFSKEVLYAVDACLKYMDTNAHTAREASTHDLRVRKICYLSNCDNKSVQCKKDGPFLHRDSSNQNARHHRIPAYNAHRSLIPVRLVPMLSTGLIYVFDTLTLRRVLCIWCQELNIVQYYTGWFAF